MNQMGLDLFQEYVLCMGNLAKKCTSLSILLEYVMILIFMLTCWKVDKLYERVP